MNHEIDLKKYDIHTDLVLDTIENSSLSIKSDTYNIDDIKVTKVNVDEETSKILNKKKGNYITIEFTDVTDITNREKVTKVFEDELKTILSDYDKSSILIVGLGNAKSTPDSLGPKALENIIVTRHLFLLENPEKNILKVSKIAPGVMADTGIETQDIISSIARKIKPSLIIVIDALAASTISRINKSIQITDTGIHPGSGIGNMRKEISNDTLGIPVIAIGIPTVVGSSIIVYDTINYLFKHISYIKDNSSKNKLVFNRYNYLDKIKDKNLSIEEKKEVLGLIGELSDTDRISLIEEVLNSLNYNFIVTPKEIDFQIDKLSLEDQNSELQRQISVLKDIKLSSMEEKLNKTIDLLLELKPAIVENRILTKAVGRKVGGMISGDTNIEKWIADEKDKEQI